jgi:hypothetical protein
VTAATSKPARGATNNPVANPAMSAMTTEVDHRGAEPSLSSSESSGLDAATLSCRRRRRPRVGRAISTTLRRRVAPERRSATSTTCCGVHVSVMVRGPVASEPGTYQPLA